MNSGTIVTNALNRCLLPVNDYAQREMAYGMLNEVVQSLWNMRRWRFRKSSFFFETSSGQTEYALHKLANEIVMNTMRGNDPVRAIKFRPSDQLFKERPYEFESGDPYWYYDGEMVGVQVQPSASSAITIQSSLANYTTGTADVAYGRPFALISTGVITFDMLGRFFRVGTDDKRYRIIKVYPVSGSSYKIDLDAPYEGTTSGAASYAIGDLGQKATVIGILDNGAIYEEEIHLNGSSGVTTNATFSALIRISKSDKTHGYITATSNGAVVTNITLDPGETEADFRTIKLYMIPTKTERIDYESYGKHPLLYKYNDAPLIPSGHHEILQIDLIIKLKSEFLGESVPQDVIDRRKELFESLESFDNDLSDWTIIPETHKESRNFKDTNLPNSYGYDDGF